MPFQATKQLLQFSLVDSNVLMPLFITIDLDVSCGGLLRYFYLKFHLVLIYLTFSACIFL